MSTPRSNGTGSAIRRQNQQWLRHLLISSCQYPEFSSRFTNWPREAYLLALISSGHSNAVDVVERAARHFDLSPQSGSLKEALDWLHRRGLITSRMLTMHLGGGGRARAALRIIGLATARHHGMGDGLAACGVAVNCWKASKIGDPDWRIPERISRWQLL